MIDGPSFNPTRIGVCELLVIVQHFEAMAAVVLIIKLNNTSKHFIASLNFIYLIMTQPIVRGAVAEPAIKIGNGIIIRLRARFAIVPVTAMHPNWELVARNLNTMRRGYSYRTVVLQLHVYCC